MMLKAYRNGLWVRDGTQVALLIVRSRLHGYLGTAIDMLPLAVELLLSSGEIQYLVFILPHAAELQT